MSTEEHGTIEQHSSGGASSWDRHLSPRDDARTVGAGPIFLTASCFSDHADRRVVCVGSLRLTSGSVIM